MVNGLSRVDSHRGFPYKQLPALKQSLARIVDLLQLGATRNQAFSLNKAKTVLGIFVSSFFLLNPIISFAQTPTPVLNQTVNQIQNQLKPSATPSNIPTPSPSTTPIPTPPPTNFQLPHTGYITTPFSSYHPGIDICIGLGMPIKPIANGVVTEAGYNIWGLGLMVEVDHGNGYKSTYSHMGKIFVTKGKEVRIDDLLGEVGMTGHTTGPHTHLELSYAGRKIDPRPLLPELRNYPKEEDFVTHQSATESAVAIPSENIASTSANIFTGIVENTASVSAKPEEEPVEKADSKLTPEKISETTLTALVAPSKPEVKDVLDLELTKKLPKTLANYSIPTDLAGDNFKNILALSMHQSRNANEKQKFETIAQENLSNLLNKTNSYVSQPTLNQTETATNIPTGGRISFDITSLFKF
jgi:murein DD-endopeptidase MepM/ murein hydrolase activator NlpD